MKPYKDVGKKHIHGYYDETFVERGGITNRLRKIIDEAVDDHYNGYDTWLSDRDKVDPFLCDCTLHADIEYYIKRQEES
jgi:hypothetical protein